MICRIVVCSMLNTVQTKMARDDSIMRYKQGFNNEHEVIVPKRLDDAIKNLVFTQLEINH